MHGLRMDAWCWAAAYLAATAPSASYWNFRGPAVRPRAGHAMDLVPAQPQEKKVPAGAVYFRKSFPMNQVESGEVQISCDNAYELYVNGRKAGEGSDWHTLDSHDITKYLTPGRNTVAIKAIVKQEGKAGLVARVVVKEIGGTYVAYESDNTWRTSLQEFPQWTKHFFNDAQWLPARTIGPFGNTPPWLDEVHAAGGAPAGRFETLPEFRVETVVPPKETGSLLAMTFNEFGEILAAREGGGILRIFDSQHDGKYDKVEPFADQITNVQGILSLNGRVFATGKGPDGLGLYCLEATSSETRADKVTTLLKFTGEAAEHGCHAVALGPDGLLYVVLGNHTQLAKEPAATSPYHHPYEGDLVKKYEDPHGEAVGIKAPCGTIVRTDVNGSFAEIFAGGLRNCYDMTFNRAGELFTWDSDMEWDVGLPWYRPTRLVHATPGAEFGSRSGWSVWPDYYFDGMPTLLDTGRGSPTGMVAYNHVMFPKRYHDALFMGDWSRGRILAIRMKQQGGAYKAESETFATGKPLNVTNLTVGPDGALYFCTGGRDSEGGIYRIVWQGKVPPEYTDFGEGIKQAIRQPQLNSAFARQKIAAVKQQLGDSWDKEIVKWADNPASDSVDRCRALDLMQLFGPFPSGAQLARLGGDPDAQVRAKAAYLMGLHPEDATRRTLVKMLQDPDLRVQRVVCESLVRAGGKPTFQELSPLVSADSRSVSYAATRLLETLPREDYRAAILKTKNTRLFLQGSLALVQMDPDHETCKAIVERCGVVMKGFVSDPDFIDLLRLMQLALGRGGIERKDIPELAEKIVLEYPTRNPQMNRELVRLVAYLQGISAGPRLMEQLTTDIPSADKLQAALYARFLDGWTTQQKLALLKYYESARTLTGGHSFAGYIDNVSRDFFAGLTADERKLVLADGNKWPSSALAVLAGLPAELPEETIEQIITLDKDIAENDSEAARRLGIGVIAVLGRSKDAKAGAYLREIYEKFPERRGQIAMALTQNPDGDNWPVLVQSLSIVDGVFAQQVLVALAGVDQKPEKPEPYRQVILRGLKLGEAGGKNAVKVLEKWTGKQLGEPSDKVSDKLAAWQKWFSETYPDQPEAKLPVESAENKWTYDELIAYLNSADGTHGSVESGAAIFTKAQCVNCHRYGERGDSVGPDLTTVRNRFQKKEILESILYPSLVISDQYISKTVVTTDGRNITGLAAPQSDGSIVVMQSNGQKITIEKDKIDQIVPSKVSAMPEGLLNTLSLEDIANLFAFLNQQPQTMSIGSKPADSGKQ